MFIDDPRVLASSNPGLKLANAFGVENDGLMHKYFGMIGSY